MIRFIKEHRDRFGVELICRVLRPAVPGFLPARGYRAASSRVPSARQLRDELLVPEIALALAPGDSGAAQARDYARFYLQLPNYTGNLRRFGYADADIEGGGSDRPPPSGGPARMPSRPAASATFSRFHGSIDVKADDPIGHFAEVVQNVIEHFTAQYGTEVTISVDVAARSRAGFDAKTVRIVKENAATLKFKIAEFEVE